FALTQIRDEQRHLAFFERALAELDCDTRPMQPLTALLAHATSAPDLPALLLGTNLVVETLAHELFLDLARLLLKFSRAWWVPARWAAALASLAHGMQVVYGDES